MTLDTLLREDMTVKIKDGERTINPNYDSNKFSQTATGIKELEALNIKNTEGVARYKTITGEDNASYSDKELRLRQTAKVENAQGVLAQYAVKHFNNLIGELDESTQINLAFNYCPEKDMENAAEYNATRGKIKTSQETLKGIRENRDVFFAELLSKEKDPMMREALTAYKDEYLQIKEGEAERAGVLAIAHYGATKFLGETKIHIGAQTETLLTKRKELETLMNQKVNNLEIEKERVLTAAENAELLADEYKQMETLFTDYIDAKTFGQLIEDTSSLATMAIQEKIEKAETEEKAKAEKKKKN